jgi:signal transduction histidine kinase
MSALQLSGPPADLIVVDDMPANLRLLSQMLSEHGHRVRAVLNGERALLAAQVTVPDLILLDIRMPELDGYETCRRLKADARTRDVPVLFISALYDVDDKIKAFAAGGVDYITKPFQPEEVLARINTHLSLVRLQRQLEQANAQLAQQVVELEERNRELDAFAHTVAHDLKNPLMQIIGYAETVLDYYEDMPDHERLQCLRAISHSTDKMDNIIEELLLLAGVRRENVTPVPLAMEHIVAEAIQRLELTLEQAHARIILPESWHTAQGHPPWVEEVWTNYLSNACKYGGQPPLIELGSDQVDDGAVRFWVRDNGNGIAPEDQPRLFVPFTRLEQARTQGYGLGLSVVRRIVEKLGGQVGVDSSGQPGQGSTFYFTLPAS